MTASIKYCSWEKGTGYRSSLLNQFPSHERTLQMNRWTIKNEVEDLKRRERPRELSAPREPFSEVNRKLCMLYNMLENIEHRGKV